MQSVLLRAILHTNGDPVHIDSSRARRTQRVRLARKGLFYARNRTDSRIFIFVISRPRATYRLGQLRPHASQLRTREDPQHRDHGSHRRR